MITPPSPDNTGTPIISSYRPPRLPPNVAASPILNPLPKPAGATSVSSDAGTSANLLSPADAQAASENLTGVSVPGPKKETARITILSKPSVPAPTLNVRKTQPLTTRPAIMRTSPVIAAPSTTIDAFDSIPRWFCWGLLGISGLIFLIQIWNYTLS